MESLPRAWDPASAPAGVAAPRSGARPARSHRQLDIAWAPSDPAARMRLTGRLGASSAPAFKQAVREALAACPGRLVVDLAQVSHLDATGLAALAEACELGRRSGSAVAIAGMPERVRRQVAAASLHCVIDLL